MIKYIPRHIVSIIIMECKKTYSEFLQINSNVNILECNEIGGYNEILERNSERYYLMEKRYGQNSVHRRK